MSTIQKIAAAAKGLSKAELHALLELAARAESSGALETTASSRELAQQTGLARASMQSAIDSLNAKQLVSTDHSSDPTRPACHRLLFLDLEPTQRSGPTVGPEVAQHLSQGGLKSGPGVAQNLGQGGLKSESGVAQELGQSGPVVKPAANTESVTYGSAYKKRVCVRSDSIEINIENIIDRLQKAQKSDFDDSLFEQARHEIASHHAKFAREENRLPGLPDDAITTQFLAVADWPRLSRTLTELAGERKEAGHSYAWYVSVALQRIHGISPDQTRAIRTRSRHINKPLASFNTSASTARASSNFSGLGPANRRPPVYERADTTDIERLKQHICAVAAGHSIR